MPQMTPLTRTIAFGVATVVCGAVGRVGFLQDSGLSLYWPAGGVIVLWALLIKTRAEYFLFAAITLVALTLVNLNTGFGPIDSFLLSLANVAMGLFTRWAAILLVPFGRAVGLSPRGPLAVAPAPISEIITRMAVPYDAFRLFGAAFIGSSLAWVVAAASLAVQGHTPSYIDGAVWVVRSIAPVMLIAGTGLALLQKTDGHRRSSVVDVLFGFGLTTAFAMIAVVMSPEIPLATMVLIPLFWTGVRSRTSVAALHAVYTTVAVLAMVAMSHGAVFGIEFDTVAMSVRLHLMITVGFLISLVVATAVNEFVRLNSDLAVVADTAHRRASALHTVTETIPDALMTVDKRGHATALNPSGETFIRDEGSDTTLVRWPGSGPSPAARALDGETIVAEPFAFTDESGAEHVVEITAAPLLPEGTDEPERALILVRDVSRNHEILRELERLAGSDPLTSVPNRRHFDRALAEHVQAHPDRGGILILDLDGFKEINDTFGHVFGDGVLIEVARILADSVEDGDVLTRLGGDEFAILFPDADRERLETTAGFLIDQIRSYAETLEGAGRALTASVGGATIASAVSQGLDPLVAADRLMYDVKYSGRDGIMIVGECDNIEEREPTQFECKVRLEEAMENDDLVLHLQPIIDAETGRLVGAEALVRQVDGDRLIPPSEFIPVAERSGIIPALDSWVIRKAMGILGRLRDLNPDMTIWINVSAHSIYSSRVEKVLFDSLAESGVPASSVILELTETAKIDDVGTARAYGSRLRKAGFQLAIDDFGTGFGSLLYLKYMLFDFVKIDGEFIADLHESSTDRAIVRSLVQMADSLNMKVVAEHVESADVLDAVRAERIHFAQGYDIGRPCPEPEFVARHLAGGGNPPADIAPTDH